MRLSPKCLRVFALVAATGTCFAAGAPSVTVEPPLKKPPMPSDIRMTVLGAASELSLSEEDVAKAYGFSTTTSHLKNEEYQLESSILGTKKERVRAEKDCKKSPFQMTETAFGCAYIALKASLEAPTPKNKPKGNPKAKAKAKAKFVHAKKNSKEKSRSRGPLLTQADWDNLSTSDYKELLPLLKVETVEEAQVLLGFSDTAKCKTAAAGSALFSQLESLLPNQNAWPAIDAAYNAISTCIPTDANYYEAVHQRMGLLNVMRKRFESAKQAFNRSLLAQKPKEENRTLFWRGMLENNLENIPAGIRWNGFWERLVTVYPLTQHAVLAHSIFAEHPISENTEKAPLPLSPHQGDSWDGANLANFIFLNAAAQKDKRTTKEFSDRITEKISSPHLGTGMFLALAHRSVENYRESMRVMYAAVKATGSSALHPEIVRLLYPTLFVKEVTKNSGNLEVPLVLSLMRQESSFNQHAKSPRGAMGLMQILPSTAKSTSKKKSAPLNLLNPIDNIAAGSRYLSQQIQKFDGNEVPTLAAYNAGPTVATRWKARYAAASPLLYADLIPYPETRAYVSGILRGRFWYRYLLGGGETQAATTQELAYAEHLLNLRLAPDLPSRTAPTATVSFLAREPMLSTDESEEFLYNEEF